MVSICMITYNHEAYITEAIDSILMQKTNFDFQLVIGEDCSKDGTRAICEKYQKEYPEKIKLLPSNQNYGMMGNFIRTLKACQQKYTAICEGDDYWTDPLKLQKQIDFMEANSSYQVCYTCCRFSTGQSSKQLYINSTFSDLVFPFEFSFENSLQKKGGPTLTMLFRHDAIDLSIYERCVQECSMGDWPLECLIMLKGTGYCFGEETAVYRKHEGGVSTTTLNILKYYHSRISFCENLLKEKILTVEQKSYLKQFLSRALFLSFITNFHFGNLNKANQSLKKSLKLILSPFKREDVCWIDMYKWHNILIHLGKVTFLKLIPKNLHRKLPIRLQYTHK